MSEFSFTMWVRSVNIWWRQLRILAPAILVLSVGFQPLTAQEIGNPVMVDLAESSKTLTLDFTDRDYVLILYSLDTDSPAGVEASREYKFSVSRASAGANSIVIHNPGAGVPASQAVDRLDLQLRRQEGELARRVQQSGGYRQSLTKIAPQKTGTTRRIVFPSHGNVAETTITAVLVATSNRASAYVDVADTSWVNKAQLQVEVNRFSIKTYPVATSTFGRESDVDNDGKIHVLYTHLVDKVAGDSSVVRGFFDARSLVPPSQDGNGNLSDLLYINPFNDSRVNDAVLAHEFQHLINFNQRTLIRNASAEEAWLNEGLSHVCEDLIDRYGVHNRRNIGKFLANPHLNPLRALVRYTPGVRGAAYLFVRSLVEDYGSEILARLVQTREAGIANVKAATGHEFTGIFERFLSRIYLSGSEFNTTLDYSTPFLSDPANGARLFPRPTQIPLSSDTTYVEGSVLALSAAFVGLSGKGNDTISLETDVEGSIRAILIPIPPVDPDQISIPRQFFSNITFDVTIEGPYISYKPIRFSGTVSDPTVQFLQFIFDINDDDKRMSYRIPVRDQRFGHTFFFSHEQVGDYRLEILTYGEDPMIKTANGVFRPFIILEGPDTSPLPADYFVDIKFYTTIPVEFRTGRAVRLSGDVYDDRSIDYLNLSYWHRDSDRHMSYVSHAKYGRFRKTILFAPKQAGVYDLNINLWRGNTLYVSPQYEFGPIVVKEGAGTATLPVDYFEGISLTEPLPIEYWIGFPVRVSGNIADPSVSQVEFHFHRSRLDRINERDMELITHSERRFFVPVRMGQFSTEFDFTPVRADDYTLDIWLWRSQSPSWGTRRFQPIYIGPAPHIDFDNNRAVGLADFRLVWQGVWQHFRRPGIRHHVRS